MKERCLVQKTGSCRGCDILSAVARRINRGEDPLGAAKKVGKQLCPEGTLPQTYVLEKRRSHTMGQPDPNGVIDPLDL